MVITIDASPFLVTLILVLIAWYVWTRRPPPPEFVLIDDE